MDVTEGTGVLECAPVFPQRKNGLARVRTKPGYATLSRVFPMTLKVRYLRPKVKSRGERQARQRPRTGK